MRFSSLLFALPFVASAFAAPLAKAEPVAVAELNTVDLVQREAFVPIHQVEVHKRQATVTEALEELVDGLIALVPDHPLDVVGDVEALVKEVNSLVEGTISKLGLGSLNPVIEGVEGLVLGPIGALLGQVVAALGKILHAVDLDAITKLDISGLKSLLTTLVHSLLTLLNGLDTILPGLLKTVSGLLTTLLGPIFPSIVSTVAGIANTFLGSIPGVTDLLKALGLLS